MSNQFEKKLVEDFVVNKLKENNWTFIESGNLQRQSITESLLINNLKKQLYKINKNLDLGEEEIKKVIDELKLLTTDINGNKRFLDFLKYGIGIKFDKERVVKIVNIFDFDHPENNEFIFTRQIHHKESELIIPDIILYINGIPVVDIECKNLFSLKTGWEEGYDQIKKYEKIASELYKYIQIGISFADKVRYFPIIPWKDQVPVYIWRKDNLVEDEAIFEMLNPFILLDILRNFLFIREENNEIKKVITRYMQYRAVNKIYQRVINNLEGKEDKNKGLIWHWQGSGKTLTMIFATHKLFFEKKLENPTIFIIVDRKELEDQLRQELSSLRLNFSFELINNIKELKDVISADNFLGRRGVFLTLIHKFRPDEKFFPETISNSISQRKNVICFLDEVHRTQYGILAAQMKNIFKSAFFFGFTGTPIAEDEKNTYDTFGYPLKEEEYLDKYFLDDSQKDGFTLPLVYQSRLEKEVGLNQNEINFFIEKTDVEEFIEDENVENEVKKRLNLINIFLENEQRIKKIAQDIAFHFKENIDNRFKAMVICGSRKACVLYKKYLDLYLNPEYSEVVMTFNQNDKEPILSFYKNWKEKYQDFVDDEKRIKKIIEDYKEKKLPKILIVTDMLITGFDAPVLQNIYLDKLIKKHRLLQAIARANRPYKDLKVAGLIIDYVGIIKNINQALRMYYKKDVLNTIMNFSLIFEEFKLLIKDLEKMFINFDFEITRENLIKAIEILRDEKVKDHFIESYKKMRKLYELLGSSSEKIEYFKKYQWFTALYQYWLKLTNTKDKDLIEDYFQKTLSIIHKNINIGRIENLIPPIILNTEYFSKIFQSELSREEKAVNILFALEKLILVDQRNNPIYTSLIGKVDELVRQWKEKKIDYLKLFNEENTIIKLIKVNEEKRKQIGLSNFDYGIFLILSKNIKIKDDLILQITKKIKDIIKDDLIENWLENPILKQNIERKTREYLLDITLQYSLSYENFNILHQDLVNFIEEYGYKQN